MRFGLLGTLEVHEDGRALPITGRRQRKLLAALLLHANHVVPPDVLIEYVWGERAPTSAAHALQVAISQLRKLLGSGVLLTESAGYVLRIGPDDLDIDRFERLAEEGHRALVGSRPADARAILRKALELWRGPPLVEFGFEPFAQPEVARLEELRLQALENRIEADLQLGHHGDVIVELRHVVTEHPLREGFRGQLMLALYRCGRQTQALQAFDDARRVLSDELGIDPDPRLQELHSAILRQDASIGAIEHPTSQEDGGTSRASEDAAAGAGRPGVPPDEVRKTVSIVFSDVTGSTSLGELLDPEALREVMTLYFDQMETVLIAHGGTVEKFIGDAVMAVFGIPLLREDDALRAVRAAAEMREALAELNAELTLRWGIELETRTAVNTGEVVSGVPTGRTLVTGDAVNIASRLEQAAGRGEVLLGAETYHLTRHSVVAEPLDPLRLKGKAQPVDAFRLLRVEPGLVRAPLRMDSPMLGRDRQMHLLRDALEQAIADHACYLVTVLGQAGIGKSRLAAEFIRTLEQTVILAGRCIPYGEGITFWPVAEMVRSAAGISDDDSPEQALGRIVTLLEGADDAEVVGMHLARLMGLASGPPAEPGWAFRRLLETLASRAPVIALLDDVHWAQQGMIETIEHVADFSRDAPILLLCLARSELLDERPDWGAGRTRAAAIQLEPLGDADGRALFMNLIGPGSVDEEIVDRVHAAARGHPLFVEQMLSVLLESGAVVRKDDRWVPTDDLQTVGTPTAITTLLAARLDLLPADERVVLSNASVVGEVFERRAVESLVARTLRVPLDETIRALLRKDLIRPAHSGDGGEEPYRFRHILLRDAAYEALPKLKRAALHEQLARWIEQTSGQRIAEVEELLGYHLEQAYRYRSQLSPVNDDTRELGERAAARLASAGRRVHDTRWDVHGTVNLLSRAWDLVPAGHAIRLEIGTDLAMSLAERGDSREAARIAEAVVTEARGAGDAVMETRARVARSLTRMTVDPEGDFVGEEAQADRAIAFLEERNDALGAARAWQLKANIHWLLTDYGGRVAASERAAAQARRVAAGWDEAEAMYNVVFGLLRGEVPVPECRRRTERILNRARESGNRRLEADAVGSLGVLAADEGNEALARQLIGQGAELRHELGREVLYWSMRSGAVGETHWWMRNLEVAASSLREGYEALGRLGETGIRSSLAGLLSCVLAELGVAGEALLFADEAEALGGPWDLMNVILAAMTRSKVDVIRGRPEDAIDQATRAVAVADRGDDLRVQGLAYLALADALRASGRPSEAVIAAQGALGRFEQKRSTVLSNHAQALLRELDAA